MRIAVTGGAGYIGSHALLQLREAGYEPVVLDNLTEGHRRATGECELIELDLSDEARVREALERIQPVAVMHFAASAYVGVSVEKPEQYYFNNVVNSLRLLRAMRSAGVKRLVFSGSCAVYGIPEQIPISEDEPMDPINPYGRTKATVEHVLADYAAAYDLRYASLRYFNAAGAAPDGSIGEDHDPETHLIPILIQAALGRRDSVSIFGADYPTRDGTCIRDYVHVLDLARAHVLALEALESRNTAIYNLGTGTGSSVREVVDTVRKVTGRDFRVVEDERRPGDPPRLVTSPRRVRSELGWELQFPELEEIVETAWNWHRRHPDGYAEN
jgi:UDP-glucose 4-epimerase